MAWANNLAALGPGDAAYVTGIDTGHDMHKRLEDIGFTQGAFIRCLFAAPSGEPRAYLVRGAVMALRSADAALVRVEAVESWD